MRITVTIEDGADYTEVVQDAEMVNWQEAHKVFFRALRGAGYVINKDDYIKEVTNDVTELVDAESESVENIAERLNVGGGGFLSE